MIKKVILGAIALIGALGAIGTIYLYTAIHQNIDEHFAGSCTELDLPGSGEDTQIDREKGFAYLSVFDRKAAASGEQAAPGTVMRVNLNEPEPRAVNALVNAPEDLHPHGLSLYIDAAGFRHLYVINHPADRNTGAERIEHFMEQSPGEFHHAETFASELITRANDLVAVAPRAFYVAQDTGQGTGISETQLVFFDGDFYTVAANDILSGGGINISADLGTLYIAETNGKRIRVAELDGEGGIASARYIELPSSPDNIDVAADGSLWIGAHSNLTALVMHFIVGTDAPTQILRVDPNTDQPAVEEIYLNKGAQISTGSGGATYGNKLLIGSITDKRILICEQDAA